jgi:hypothetical protein
LGKEAVMNSSLDIDIREKLASYIVGDISLEDFEDWFVSSSWNVMQREKKRTIDLVYDIELILAEHSRGCWDEDELKNLLRPMVENYYIEIDGPGIELSSNSQIDQWLISVPLYILSSGASL